MGKGGEKYNGDLFFAKTHVRYKPEASDGRFSPFINGTEGINDLVPN